MQKLAVTKINHKSKSCLFFCFSGLSSRCITRPDQIRRTVWEDSCNQTCFFVLMHQYESWTAFIGVARLKLLSFLFLSFKSLWPNIWSFLTISFYYLYKKLSLFYESYQQRLTSCIHKLLGCHGQRGIPANICLVTW